MANGNIDSLNIKIKADAKKAGEALDRLCSQLSDLQTKLKLDTSSIAKIGDALNQKNAIDEFAGGIKKAKRQLKGFSDISLSGTISDLKEVSQISFENLKGLADIDFKNLVKVQKGSQKAASGITDLDDALQGVKSNLNLEGLNTTQLEKGLSKTQTQISKLLDKEQYMQISGKNLGDPWLKLQYDIALAYSNLEAYGEALDKIRKKSENFTISKGESGSFSSDIPKAKSIDKSSFGYSKSAMSAVFPEFSDVENFEDLMKRTGKNAAQAGLEINNAFGEVGRSAKEASNVEPKTKIWESFAKVLKTIDRKASSIFKGFKKVTSEIKTISKAFANFAKKIGNAASIIPKLSIGFAKILKSITGIGKNKNKDFGIGKMLGMSVLYSSIFQAIGAMQNAIKTGSDNLVQYSASYNSAISSIVSALTQLKNAFATAFQPILEIVSPILVNFINLMSNALTKVGAFFSALTGKTLTTKAVSVSVDYAAGLQDIGSSADDATGSAEDLGKALSVLSFDELNQLQKVETPSSGSGAPSGGAGEINPSDMFEDIPIPSYIKDFADKIKEAWEKADFSEIGQILGNKINEALEGIPWEKIKSTVSKIAKSVATFLNGSLETINFRLVGNTLAEGLNIALVFLDTFAQEFHFDSLGKAIGDGINGLVQGIDLKTLNSALVNWAIGISTGINNLFSSIEWEKNAVILGEGLNSVINSLNILVTQIDFMTIGTYLASAINSLFSTVNFYELGKLIGNSLMILPNTLLGIVLNLNFAEIGGKLSDLINGIFNSINFTDIAILLYTGFNGLMDIVRNFTLTVDWGSIAQNIYNGLNTMIHGVDWAAAGQTLSLFVTDLLGTFVKVAQNTDWEGFGRGIGDFLSNIDWFTIIGQVGTILWEAFSGVLSGLFDTSAGKVVVGFVAGLSAVRAAFGLVNLASAAVEWVSSTKKNLSKLISFLKDTLIPGVSNGIGKIIETFGTIAKGAKTAISLASDALKGIVSVIGIKGLVVIGIIAGVALIIKNWDKIKEAAGKVKDFVSEKWNQLMDFLSGIPGKIGDVVGDIVDWFDSLPGKIGYAIGFAAGKIASWVIDLKNIVVEKVPQIIESAVSFFAELPEKIWNAIVSAGTRIKEWATNLYNIVTEEIPKIPEKVVEFFSSLPEKIKEIGENLITGFLEGIQSVWSDVKEGVGDFVDGVIRGFTDGFDTHSPSRITEGIGENVGKGLINGIDSQSSGALTTVQGMADQIIDRMSAAMNGITDNIDRTMRNLQYTLDDAQRNANNSAWNIQSAFSNLYIPLPHIDWSWNNIDFGAFSFSIPSFSINWYKTGGLFTKATVAGIGEAGNEAVLPLENRRTMSMIANSILDNATGDMGLSKEEMRQAVTEGVVMAMMNNSQNQQPITVYAELKTESDEVLARAVTRGQKKIDYRMNPVGQF